MRAQQTRRTDLSQQVERISRFQLLYDDIDVSERPHYFMSQRDAFGLGDDFLSPYFDRKDPLYDDIDLTSPLISGLPGKMKNTEQQASCEEAPRRRDMSVEETFPKPVIRITPEIQFHSKEPAPTQLFTTPDEKLRQMKSGNNRRQVLIADDSPSPSSAKQQQQSQQQQKQNDHLRKPIQQTTHQADTSDKAEKGQSYLNQCVTGESGDFPPQQHPLPQQSGIKSKKLKKLVRNKRRTESKRKSKSNRVSIGNPALSDVKPCAICLGMPEDNLFGVIACSHEFCLDCIVQWSEVTNQCPMCRKEFLSILTRDYNETSGSMISTTSQSQKVIRVEPKRQRIADDEEFYWEEVSFLEDDLQDDLCYICETDQDGDKLIICDHCGIRICHTYCDNDLFDDSVPLEDWFCHECRYREELFE